MSVFKDNHTNTWACKFRYTDFDGNTKQHKKTGFTTKKSASEYEEKTKKKLEGSSDDSFESVATKYLEWCKATLKPTTYEDRQLNFHHHFIPYFGKMKMEDITKAKVREWQLSILNGDYKPSTQRKLHLYLSAFFTYCVELGYYEVKPMPKAIGSPKAVHIDYWTMEEFEKFIDAVTIPLYQVAFRLLYCTGMRIGELRALTYADFDFNNNTVSINKNVHTIRGKEFITTPKTPKSIRTISIPKDMMILVGRYFVSNYGMTEDDHLFFNAVNSFRKAFENAIKISGVKRIRIHDLRHSHASMLINLGMPINMVSKRLGHENIQTTLDTYTHLYESKEKELEDKMNEVFTIKDNTMLKSG